MDLCDVIGWTLEQVEDVFGKGESSRSRGANTTYHPDVGLLVERDADGLVEFAEVDGRWPHAIQGRKDFFEFPFAVLRDAVVGADPDALVQEDQGFQYSLMRFCASEGDNVNEPASLIGVFRPGYNEQ